MAAAHGSCRKSLSRGFTIVELLVVVSIIGLLMGILLPAIGKARGVAKRTISQSNLRQLGIAHHTYAAEWKGRQFTLVDDNFGRYGSDPNSAAAGYLGATGADHPAILLGWGDGASGYGLYGYYMSWAGNPPLLQPIDFSTGFGWFRLPNAKQFNQYLNGRYYDEVFYAPKDETVFALLEDCFESPYEFTQCLGTSDTIWSSYCMSPAALYAPNVFADPDRGGFRNPFDMDGGLRVPGIDQAQFSDLKTHMLEHHWLQQTRSDCNPAFVDGTYEGCEPYYFNLGYESVPVTLFYDGHVESVGVRQAISDDRRVQQQTDSHGLWSRDTPFGEAGYFLDVAYDTESEPGRGTSFHILTTNGVRGRDVLGN